MFFQIDKHDFMLIKVPLVIFQPTSKISGTITVVRGQHISATTYNGSIVLNIEAFGPGSFATLEFTRRHTPKWLQWLTKVFRRKNLNQKTEDGSNWDITKETVEITGSNSFSINDGDIIGYCGTPECLVETVTKWLLEIGVNTSDLEMFRNELCG